MWRRGFLRLASAAVLGVLASKVPVFAEDPVGDWLEGQVGHASGHLASMYVYPTYYALPMTVSGEWMEYTKEHLRTFREMTNSFNVDLRGEGAVKPL